MNKNEEKKPGETSFSVPATDVYLNEYINKIVKEKKISSEEISRIASLFEYPHLDRYEPRAFLRDLWLISVGFQDMRLAINLDNYVEGARMHGNQQMSEIIYEKIANSPLNVALSELAKTYGEKTLLKVLYEVLKLKSANQR